MSILYGEFECKLDAKGRMVLPSALKRKLPNVETEGLVISRGFDNCLAIYPKKEWDKIAEELSQLNAYDKRNRDFSRYFSRGVADLSLDSAGRILLPKSLLDSARIESDVVLFCQFNKIEVWAKDVFDEVIGKEPEDFPLLAEEVMVKKTGRKDNE